MGNKVFLHCLRGFLIKNLEQTNVLLELSKVTSNLRGKPGSAYKLTKIDFSSLMSSTVSLNFFECADIFLMDQRGIIMRVQSSL